MKIPKLKIPRNATLAQLSPELRAKHELARQAQERSVKRTAAIADFWARTLSDRISDKRLAFANTFEPPRIWKLIVNLAVAFAARTAMRVFSLEWLPMLVTCGEYSKSTKYVGPKENPRSRCRVRIKRFFWTVAEKEFDL